VLDDMKNEGWKIPDELPVVSIEAKTKKEAIANIARFSSSHGLVTTQGAINLFGLEGLKLIAPTIRIPQLAISEIILLASEKEYPEQEYDEDLECNSECPKCGYEWQESK